MIKNEGWMSWGSKKWYTNLRNSKKRENWIVYNQSSWEKSRCNIQINNKFDSSDGAFEQKSIGRKSGNIIIEIVRQKTFESLRINDP